jgi:CheY-like chemotaxis protein
MSKRILIVDDDRDFTEGLATRVRSLGVEVFVAHNSLSAITTFGQARPDLVCLDVEMPTGDGLRICEFLGSSPDTANVPVIILTGRSDPETVRRCGELNANYVRKSQDLWGRLKPVIQSHLFGAPSVATVG